MAAIEEHKPAEKRRALGRGLDSLLPSGPRVVTSAASVAPAAPRTEPALSPSKGMSEAHGAVVVPPPVVISTPPVVSGSAAPAVVPDFEGAGLEGRPYTVPGEAHREEIAEIHAASRFSQQKGEVRHPTTSRAGAPAPHEICEIRLELIDENPYQTRKTFDETALNELAESIKANGLAQPVVVRPERMGDTC